MEQQDILYTSLTLLLSWMFFNIFYLISHLKKDMSIIDVAWGLSFLSVLYPTLYFYGDGHHREYILMILVTTWALRLSLHLFFRWLHKSEEDFRYKSFREQWKTHIPFKSYTRVFMLQWLLMLVITSQFYFIVSDSKSTITLTDYMGALLAFFGLCFEAIADYQMYHFKKRSHSRGKILKSGLWHYSRHPNYFGEATMWWGIFLLSLENTPFYYTIWSPLVITFLLTRVSGVPMLEKKYKNNPEYLDYIHSTNAFIPWFPKSKDNEQ